MMDHMRSQGDYDRFMRYIKAFEAINDNQILEVPTVVFDFGGDEFWNALNAHISRGLGMKRIENGDLIPLNTGFIMDITQRHAHFHGLLNLYGRMPMIPTYVNFDIPDEPSSQLLQYAPHHVSSIPNIYVKKQSVDNSGKLVAHGGRGINILRLDNEVLKKHLPQGPHELLQHFVIPPKDTDGQRFVRDLRAFVIGGKTEVVLERRAAQPLTEANLLGDVVPTIEQIYSAQHRGPRGKASAEIEEKVRQAAENVVAMLTVAMQRNDVVFSPHSPVGFMSIDFILDDTGTPLPVDCDVSPMIDTAEDTHLTVARSLAACLAQLANTTGKSKQVVIYGRPPDELHQLTVKLTTEALTAERVSFQPSVFS